MLIMQRKTMTHSSLIFVDGKGNKSDGVKTSAPNSNTVMLNGAANFASL